MKLTKKHLSLIILVLFGIVALWQTVISTAVNTTSAWGTIYLLGFLFSVMFVIASFIPGLEDIFEYEMISDEAEDPKNFWLQVGIGIAIGLALTSSALFGIQSFLAPLKIPVVFGFIGWEAIGQIIIMSIFVSEFEETLRSGTLRPSFAEWVSAKGGRIILLLILGFLLWGLVANNFVKMLGIALMILGGINFASGYTRSRWDDRIDDFFGKELVRKGFAILFAAGFFMLLHWAAFNDPLDPATTGLYLFSAFFFATIADFFATYFKDTIVGRVAHTFNNGVVSSLLAGVTVWFAFFVVGFHILLMKTVAKYGE